MVNRIADTEIIMLRRFLESAYRTRESNKATVTVSISNKKDLDNSFFTIAGITGEVNC
jgi:hypothetical protein